MSSEKGKTTFIPCEPFEARVFDINQAKVVTARVTGYHVAIRELEIPHQAMFTPIALASGDRHGIIAVPAWEEVPQAGQ